jgi:hypothetical protein
MPIANRVLKLQIVINGIATTAPRAISKIAMNATGPTLYDVIPFLHRSDLGQLLLDGLVFTANTYSSALLVHPPNMLVTV